jgi:hypothetical protein
VRQARPLELEHARRRREALFEHALPCAKVDRFAGRGTRVRDGVTKRRAKILSRRVESQPRTRDARAAFSQLDFLRQAGGIDPGLAVGQSGRIARRDVEVPGRDVERRIGPEPARAGVGVGLRDARRRGRERRTVRTHPEGERGIVGEQPSDRRRLLRGKSDPGRRGENRGGGEDGSGEVARGGGPARRSIAFHSRTHARYHRRPSRVGSLRSTSRAMRVDSRNPLWRRDRESAFDDAAHKKKKKLSGIPESFFPEFLVFPFPLFQDEMPASFRNAASFGSRPRNSRRSWSGSSVRPFDRMVSR